jgi:hypothetical protein
MNTVLDWTQYYSTPYQVFDELSPLVALHLEVEAWSTQGGGAAAIVQAADLLSVGAADHVLSFEATPHSPYWVILSATNAAGMTSTLERTFMLDSTPPRAGTVTVCDAYGVEIAAQTLTQSILLCAVGFLPPPSRIAFHRVKLLRQNDSRPLAAPRDVPEVEGRLELQGLELSCGVSVRILSQVGGMWCGVM